MKLQKHQLDVGIVQKKPADLHFYPYRTEIIQKLQENDYECRRCCEKSALSTDEPEFSGNLSMNHEAHFDLDGYVD